MKNSQKQRIGILRILSIFLIVWHINLSISFSSSLVLDNVNILEIKDMQIKKSDNHYYLDIICLMKSDSNYTLKLQNIQFIVSFSFNKSKEIKLGMIKKDEIFLKKHAADLRGIVDISFLTHLGTEIEDLYFDIIESEEMSYLLTQPDLNPKLNLHIKGIFNLETELQHGWMYQDNLRIDWITTVSVPRDVLKDTFKEIELFFDIAKGVAPFEDNNIFK